MIPLLALRAQITEMTIPEALLYALVGILVVMSVLALLSVLIRLISKLITSAESKAAKKTEQAPREEQPQPAAKAVKAEVELVDVDEETAAVIMAIVAQQSGIAPERLAFKSIRLMKS